MSNQDRAEGVSITTRLLNVLKQLRDNGPTQATLINVDRVIADAEAQPRDAAGGVDRKLVLRMVELVGGTVHRLRNICETQLRGAGCAAVREQYQELQQATTPVAVALAAPQAPGADTPPATTEGEDRLAEILHRLDSWSKAYPEDVFTPTTHKEIQAVASAFPGMVDRISASMGRHMVKHMREMADVIRSHPAESSGGDSVDSQRLDFIERTFSGMTNRERYLPVQMVWGKGAMGRTLREACDKYMARAAIAQGAEHGGHFPGVGKMVEPRGGG